MSETSNAAPETLPVVLSYGMGVDSTAILLKWLDDPTSRDFDLSNLVVLTSMVGDEFSDTARLVETHILPRLRAAGVRYVQVAKATKSETDGITVLDDSRAPAKLHIQGAYRLSQELRSAGTVPQVASGRRLCSVKSKGFVLDTWLKAEFGDRPYRHVIGFNAEEMGRVERDCSYSTVQRHSEYPLVTWGMGRKACEDYIAAMVGEPWAKSCCVFCPFAGGKKAHIERLRQYPQAAADTLYLEAMSLALNPRMSLYKGKTFKASLEQDGGHTEALVLYEEKLQAGSWAIYRVRRAYTGPGQAKRALTVEGTYGSKAEAEAALQGEAVVVEGFARVYAQTRREGVYPAVEDMRVAAPAGVEEKVNPAFGTYWARAMAEIG